MKFKSYYWRVIGTVIAGGGAAWILDEFIHGPFTLTPSNHEFWGLIMVVLGLVCITRKPHGK